MLVSGVQQSESVIHTHIQSFWDYCPHFRSCWHLETAFLITLLLKFFFFFFKFFFTKLYQLESDALDHLGILIAYRTALKSDFIDIPVQIPRRACKDIHICTQKLLILNDLSRQKFKFFHESWSWKLKEFYCIIWEIWSG